MAFATKDLRLPILRCLSKRSGLGVARTVARDSAKSVGVSGTLPLIWLISSTRFRLAGGARHEGPSAVTGSFGPFNIRSQERARRSP
jgi:hypothetical protein